MGQDLVYSSYMTRIRRRTVKFFANTPDDSHCFQAVLKMVISHFWPHEEYDWATLDTITARVAPYTWPTAGTLWALKRGLCVNVIESFDHRRFSTEGYRYLLNEFGPEVADDQKLNSKLEQEMKFSAELLRTGSVETRVPCLSEVAACVGGGGVAVCNVNSRVLNGRDGYAGHFVVILEVDRSGVHLHDPGLPPLSNRYVDTSRFEKAWGYPDDRARNLTCFRRVIRSKYAPRQTQRASGRGVQEGGELACPDPL